MLRDQAAFLKWLAREMRSFLRGLIPELPLEYGRQWEDLALEDELMALNHRSSTFRDLLSLGINWICLRLRKSTE